MKTTEDIASDVERSNKSGVVLTVVVLIVVSVVGLGVSTMTMSAGATIARITTGHASKAYYLAESGVEYVKAIRQIIAEALPNGTYTLDGGDQIQLSSVVVSNGLKVVSIGIVNLGGLTETRRRITFIVFDGTSEVEVLPLGFDYDDDGEFDDDTWDLVGLKKADIVETGPSGGETALDLMGTEGTIQLNWQDNPDLDLVSAWNNNGQLLSYELQMKISPFETGNEQAYSHHYMLGFSFRLYPDTNTSYGVSFFRSRLLKSNGKPITTSPGWIPAVLEPLRGTNVYVVLWYKKGSLFELMNYKLLDDASGIIWSHNGVNELRDYSTLLLKLDEQFDLADDRENHISAYLQNTDVYPNWDSSDDMRWSDDATVFPAPVQWQAPVTQDHVDNRITSAGFDVERPSEIAVHVYYDLPGANKKFFDDFAMKMEGFETSSGSGGQIQY